MDNLKDMVILNNTGAAPYSSTSAVKKFIVKKSKTVLTEAPLPAMLRAPDVEVNTSNALVRILLMVEIDDEDNPLHSLLSNHTWRDPITEKPEFGSTEIWEFINFTPDAHPMHVHLIEFKALNQQTFDVDKLTAGECEIFNTTYATPGMSFTGELVAPSYNQIGRKDTVLSLPNYVTRIAVQWKSQAGEGKFTFDAMGRLRGGGGVCVALPYSGS